MRKIKPTTTIVQEKTNNLDRDKNYVPAFSANSVIAVQAHTNDDDTTMGITNDELLFINKKRH
jgi:hypothetical protein